MRRMKIIGIVTACVAVLAGVSLAANRFGPRDPERAYAFISASVNRMMDKIDATDAQRAQINQIKDRLFKEGAAFRQDRWNMRQQFFANWDAPQVDASEVHARVDQQVNELRTFAHDLADASIQVHDLLTPEQRATLKQEISKLHRSRMHPSEE